jgi:ferredoxin
MPHLDGDGCRVSGAGQVRLVVDRIACDGRGLCAELLPELIELDDWGYPILIEETVPRSLERHARRAVADCPVLALKLAAIEARR